MKYKEEALVANIIIPKIHPSKNKYKCSICNDKRGITTGEYCRNNEISPHYDDDLITGTDYNDCWVYIRGNETEKEHWDRLKKERGWDKTDN